MRLHNLKLKLYHGKLKHYHFLLTLYHIKRRFFLLGLYPLKLRFYHFKQSLFDVKRRLCQPKLILIYFNSDCINLNQDLKLRLNNLKLRLHKF